MLRKGVSKEHRKDPIVQIGLFMDTNGFPISYGLFSGNTLDKQTFIPMMDKLQDDYSLGKIIVVADRGMIREPEKYSRSTSYGATKYIKNLSFDKETGEILTNTGKVLELDETLIAEEEKYDGYYAIVTSEYNLSDRQVLDIYRGLWKIEESFRITKSDLETRPVYLQNLEHIQAHFLICFVTLVLARLLEYRLGRKYGVSAILESLRKCECSLIKQNVYLFDYYNEILNAIGELLDIDFSKRYRTLGGEIKKALVNVKKRKNTTLSSKSCTTETY